jgi:hypothetical protein
MAGHKATPVIPPNSQIGKDLAALLAAQQLRNEMLQQIKALAAALTTMKNPMFGVMELMNDYSNSEGAQIQGEAAVDNVDSDLRNTFSNGQSGFNRALNNADIPPDAPDKKGVAGCNSMIKAVHQIELFIKYEKSQGNNSVVDKGTLGNLQQAVTQIKSAFGGDWGNATAMATDIDNWSYGSGSGNGNGQYQQAFKSIQDGFQTANQSVSALSTTTNTQLQFSAQQFQQFLGTMQSAIQSLQQLTAASVQAQVSH